jgi:hypothetical protein
MDAPLGRRPLAEAVGTGILVLFGAGSVVAALTLGGGELGYSCLGMIAIARPRLFDEPEPHQSAAGDIEGRATGRFVREETTKEE